MSIVDAGLFQSAEIQETDPSKIYRITHDEKVGSGACGKVFKVKRKSDGEKVALKFSAPKNDA